MGVYTVDRLKTWMDNATRRQKRELAARAGTSKEYLNQIINGHRNLSVGKAITIVESANAIREESEDDSFPILTQGDLSPVCAKCHYFKQGMCDGSNEE